MIKEWSDFLEQSGGWVVDGRVEHFGQATVELWTILNNGDSCSELSCLGLIAVEGAEAEQFLQGQLTCDVRQATPDHSLLGAFCSPKGRALACFRLFRRGETLYLELPQELVEPTLTRLRKYVLRTKVTLQDASDALVRFGVAGPHAEALLIARLGVLPDVVNHVIHTPSRDGSDLTIIRVPATITPRFAVYGSLSAMQTLWTSLGREVTFTGGQPWRLLNMLAGIPTIYPETVEMFVPQMMNLEILDGISFKKGCYTGQEVVARTHYLGKLKRRMYLGRVESENLPRPGDSLFSPQADASQGAGRIVDAAEHPGGGYAVLASALIPCAEQGVLHLGDANGPTLRLEPLPYALA
ncbi:MAG: folate-binding protein YgfZ [Candidatus Competibacteraceae bacterium]|nr:folate-binding protein YgfZ [Candidatus Competibacteraceae bacterium]MCB1821256.1 folate-binding protein YgfZ [Candidatus Competibacteraceae bacterium]HRY14706.1 folate-binding protein [Candidatus Competibacteraceae bacterium]